MKGQDGDLPRATGLMRVAGNWGPAESEGLPKVSVGEFYTRIPMKGTLGVEREE